MIKFSMPDAMQRCKISNIKFLIRLSGAEFRRIIGMF